MPEMHTLLNGRALLESPRWHAGQLWFADWGAGEIIALDRRTGLQDVVASAASPPLSFDFTPDGHMLVVAAREQRLLRRERSGRLVTHADLSHLGKSWNEIVVDGRGNTYVNGGNLDPSIGNIDLITANGDVRRVAENAAFPNGMAITPDNKTLILAESYGHRLTAYDIASNGDLGNARVWADLGRGVPDGICIDAERAVWYADVPNQRCVRVCEGGEVLATIDIGCGAFACMLGGANRTTLFVTAAQWFGMDRMHEMAGTGCVLATKTTVPGAGWPF